ncbi:hypothetical protein PtB15_18B397 [Puccinia triticina]|nr:hypothetical protein PtB15_18B397 [Puccinia triticina]
MSLPSPKNPSPDNTPKLQDTVTPSNHGTPPPTQAVLDMNFPGCAAPPAPILPAPSFQEFSRNSNDPTSATTKEIVNTLEKALTSTKRTWEETGEIPKDEEIKIHQSSTKIHPPTTSTASKQPTRKKPKTRKGNSVKPVDLLNPKPNSSPTITGPIGSDQTAPPSQPAPDVSSGQPSESTLKDVQHFLDKQHQHSEIPAGDQGQTNAPADPLLDPSSVPPPNPLSEPVPPEQEPPTSIPTSLLPSPHPPSQTPGVPSASTSSLPHGNQPPQTPSDVPPQPTTSSESAVPTTNNPLEAGDKLPNNTSTPLTNSNLTIIKSVDVRIKLVKLHQELDGVKPNWNKYQDMWKSLSKLVQFQARSMETEAPHNPDFHFARTSCSYSLWIKNISSLAPEFLGPSTNEQWYCPDIIDFPLLSRFLNKDEKLQPHEIISPFVKTTHPESTLVRFLVRLQNPPANFTSSWAKIVAASIELMAENLYKPPPPETAEDDDEITQAVQVLDHLENMKNSSSTFDSTDENIPTAESDVIPRSHSVDVLHTFCNMIIDVFMGYVIFQTHGLSQQPLTGTQRKKVSRATRSSTKKLGDSAALTTRPQGDSSLTDQKDESGKRLRAHQSRQNFQPLIYFLLAGVRGLFISSRDHRTAPVSECMSFVQAMSIIMDNSVAQHTPEEPIWKNLSAYIVRLFQPAFQSPNKISTLHKPPTRTELAEAITTDFLKHWQHKQPTSPFLIPHSSSQITEK